MASSVLTGRQHVTNKEEFYQDIMDSNAESGKSLLVRLAPGSPDGDFGLLSHTWTPAQKEAWKKDKKPPHYMNDTLGDAQVLLQSVHFPTERDCIRGVAGNIMDIRISKEMFTRLNQITTPGVRIFMLERETSCLMFPSQIFTFTEEEKLKYQKGDFKEDGSDLICLDALIQRSGMSASGLGHPVVAPHRK